MKKRYSDSLVFGFILLIKKTPFLVNCTPNHGHKKAVGDLIVNIPQNLAQQTFNSLTPILFKNWNLLVNFDKNSVSRTTFSFGYSAISLRTNHLKLLANKFGHAVDGLSLKRISKIPKFVDIFNKERKNLTELVTHDEYEKIHSEEFFEEVFKVMYSTSSKQRAAVKKEASNTVKYIEEKIKRVIE
ncbi:hypothetical protein IAW_05712 [Bacillus cereus str. Schrouff]|uniref:anthrax toxin lethal factor-related metalloendopeptidase n=1 Tax=Bacillus cereus TaxID=1396 RepID=UPI0003300A5D|nr:hypothetical protein [Bacillus cereus]EOO04896.1 hypothetical protein IAW_05712 [Bacillus cereus str. Schrouff]EOO81566.1 hypothetical protein IGY_05792 [Bacillus cereus K-5975c]